MIRALRTLLVLVLVTAALAAALEGGARLHLRLVNGRWPHTLLSNLEVARANSAVIFRTHPYLGTAPRPGTSTVSLGHKMTFNALGYRSPERPQAKPPGALRIVAAGGSTTFDIHAANDEATWPAQLERGLAQRGVANEVWNAGFPGWTSQENMIALAIRDLDLHPDLLILYQGINDLQPGAHVPFDPQYEEPHARLSQQALGIVAPPLSWRDRSVFLEYALPLAQRWTGVRPAPTPSPPPIERIPDEALAVFERNVQSFIEIGRRHGARTLLVTQPLRIRDSQPELDRLALQSWIPGLSPDTLPRELERYNDVLRRLATGDTQLADAARDIEWADQDFADPMHFAPPGSAKLAAYLAQRLATGFVRVPSPLAGEGQDGGPRGAARSERPHPDLHPQGEKETWSERSCLSRVDLPRVVAADEPDEHVGVNGPHGAVVSHFDSQQKGAEQRLNHGLHRFHGGRRRTSRRGARLARRSSRRPQPAAAASKRLALHPCDP